MRDREYIKNLIRNKIVVVYTRLHLIGWILFV